MADVEVLQGLQEAAESVEVLVTGKEEIGGVIGGDGVVSASPKFRHSARKKSLRSFNSRGRLAKSKPKSPMALLAERMVEMRRGGLKGKALRQSGSMGLEGSVLKSKKGAKGLGGRGRQLATILEGDVVGGVVEVGMEEGGGIGVDRKKLGGSEEVMEGTCVVATSVSCRGSPSRRAGEGGPSHLELIPVGDCADLALDLVSSQPLQEMEFVGEQLIKGIEGGVPVEDCVMVEARQKTENRQPNDLSLEIDEEFPPLSKEGLKVAKEKERNKAVGGKGRSEECGAVGERKIG